MSWSSRPCALCTRQVSRRTVTMSQPMTACVSLIRCEFSTNRSHAVCTASWATASDTPWARAVCHSTGVSRSTSTSMARTSPSR